MVVNQDLVTDELVEERYADATAPGAREAMISMGMSFFNKDTAEDGMLWRDAHKIRKHTLLTWGREDRVNPLDGAMVALKAIPRATPACLPELWALGPDRGRGRVRRGRHQLPRPPRGESESHDRHQVHGLRPRRLHRP